MQLSVFVISAMLSTAPVFPETTVICQGLAYNLTRDLVAVKQAGISRKMVIQEAREWAVEQKVGASSLLVVLGAIDAIYTGRGGEEAVAAFVNRCVRDNAGGTAI